jgi:hypothetical protein
MHKKRPAHCGPNIAFLKRKKEEAEICENFSLAADVTLK